MALRVVGVGLGRTGTSSLKTALEQLLGGSCYHMREVFVHPEHAAMWLAAARGEPVDWDELFTGYNATVDWPAASFWRELTDAYPDAVVLLSTRSDAATWWRSANRTIFEILQARPEVPSTWHEMWDAIARNRFTEHLSEEGAAIAAYEAHNAAVRAAIPSDRLVEWQPGDGWEPLSRALGVPEPDQPFPHENTTADFRDMAGLDRPA
ncbi:MAG: hypothetical protein QOG64_26 [Acidimicrobiaceae bacterium]|nr:hypothetical protein [Acidimicrobiaceae bacterium]